MPNPKLETYKNKATGDVYDYTDADAQGKLTAILDGTTIDSFADVESALADKVDAVAGKGLSTNDYDDTEKAKVAAAFPRSEQAILGAENLFNPAYATSGASDYYVPIYVGDNITVTLSSNMPKNNSDGANLFLLAGNVQSGISTATNGVWIDNPRTVTAVSGYITICSRNSAGVNPVDYNHMLNLGTVARPFVPYAMTNQQLTGKKVDKIGNILTSSNDLDDIKESGFYSWENSVPTNSPQNKDYSSMVVIATSNRVVQQVYNITSQGCMVYFRRYSAGTGWGSWFSIVGTVVS